MGPYARGAGAYMTLPDGDRYPDPDHKEQVRDMAGGGAGTGRGKWDSAITEPYFISDIQFSQIENYNVLQCFGGRNYTYAFGHDPKSSMLEVQFTAFLVSADGQSFGDSLYTLTKAYGKNRLFKKPEYTVLTLGKLVLRGFIVGMKTGTSDPAHNVQTFSLIVVLVDSQDWSGN